MRKVACTLAVVSFLVTVPSARAQSLWDRRDPNAYLFNDTRARRIGDLLTIVVDETTEFAGQDKKEMEKKTSNSGQANANATYTMGQTLIRTFTGEIDGSTKSDRQFQGNTNNTIDRKLADHMTVVVVAVFPNGNLLIEGRRSQVITHETRTLIVRGVVRPVDIGAYNMVLSQFIADLVVTYEGHGPESSYTNHGWLGKMMNKVWPF